MSYACAAHRACPAHAVSLAASLLQVHGGAKRTGVMLVCSTKFQSGQSACSAADRRTCRNKVASGSEETRSAHAPATVARLASACVCMKMRALHAEQSIPTACHAMPCNARTSKFIVHRGNPRSIKASLGVRMRVACGWAHLGAHACRLVRGALHKHCQTHGAPRRAARCAQPKPCRVLRLFGPRPRAPSRQTAGRRQACGRAA